MKLAPMRSRAALPNDRIDVEEITLIVDFRAARARNRHATALMVRAQHARVAADSSIFRRVDADRVLVWHEFADLPQSLFPVFDRDGVFEFMEVRDFFDRMIFELYATRSKVLSFE